MQRARATNEWQRNGRRAAFEPPVVLFPTRAMSGRGRKVAGRPAGGRRVQLVTPGQAVRGGRPEAKKPKTLHERFERTLDRPPEA